MTNNDDRFAWGSGDILISGKPAAAPSTSGGDPKPGDPPKPAKQESPPPPRR